MVVVGLLSVGGPGGDRGVMRAQAADRVARSGDLRKARAQWGGLWGEGAHLPGLAARLAWAELRNGSLGPASLWALRGDRGEPRDPALAWVIGKIRETGGFTGFAPARLPVRRIEWSILALILGAGTAWVWPRRGPALAGAALVLAAVVAYPLQGWVGERAARGVVSSGVRLEGTDIELEPGQVVTVLDRSGGRVHASAGRGVSGWVPRSAVEVIGPLR